MADSDRSVSRRSSWAVSRKAAYALAAACMLGVAREARAQGMCQAETECSVKKPNVLLVLDYSSSMVGSEPNPAWFPDGQTVTKRWDAQLDAVRWIMRYDDGFFANNTRLGLARFAHDPVVEMLGTTIATDTSFPPITDGFALDVPFNGSDGAYLECRGSAVEAEVEVLRTTPPPWIQMTLDPTVMMLTWTRGALRSAHDVIDATRASHAGEPGEDTRAYEVVLMTDGDWTCPSMIGQGCDEDPAPEAARLAGDGARVHVVAFGDATMQPSLDEVALQGGTVTSIDAASPQGIIDALSGVLDDIRDSVIVPECTRRLPRVLVIMDGSSSMIEGSAPGATKWDKARFALTGNPAAPNPGDPGYVEPVFSRTIAIDGREVAIEDVIHLGLMTFSTAEEQHLLVGFGPCMRDNFAWAMDPMTSCVAPGCTDPYAGYPITWTFQDSAERDPPFVRPTKSYMPACNMSQGSDSCVGQIPNTFTGEGVEFARTVIDGYKSSPAPFSAGDDTRYVNILISDGQTSEGSSSVQAPLEAMAADGIATYVIGFGTSADLDEAQLDQYAAWGQTGSAIIVDPGASGGASALADAIEDVVLELGVDACCVLNECAVEEEPADPQPVCGNGVIEGEEVCDDGAENASYGHCGGRCDGPHLYCGDSRVDGPEECDDANTIESDQCTSRCTSTGDDDGGADESTGGVGGMFVPEAGGAGGAGGFAGGFAGSGVRPQRPDAGTMVDAGTTAANDSGCGCSAPGGASKRPQLLALLLAFVVVAARLRRRGR
jgi:MYXO-CTERM domain-containing protein